MEPTPDSPQDIRRASADGRDADGVWLTFVELGRARGISRASAARLVRRRKWRKRTDNHGVVQVYVPAGADEPADRDTGHPTGVLRAEGGGYPADVSHAISALEAAIEALREQLAEANRRAGSADQRADRAELATSELRAQLEALNRQLVEAQTAVQGADELRAADDTRRALSRWARAWAAWRGR